MKQKLAVLLSLVMTISLTACSSAGNSNKSMTFASEDVMYETAAAPSYYGNGFSEENVAYDTLSSENAAENDLSERKIIKTASLSYQTQAYDDFMDSMSRCVTSYGGYIESSEFYGNSMYSSRSSRSAYLTVRIPAENYEKFMADAGNLGTLARKSESENDVTMSYIDIESHINALEAERDSLMALMAKAESLSDVIDLQSRLTDVNYQLDSYNSQLRKYDSLISYCTVNIDIDEVVREVVAESDMTFGERIASGLEESFVNIGEGAVDFAVWFLTSLPYIIIAALFVIAVVLIIKLIKSRKRAKKLSAKQVKEYVRQINEDNNSENN